MALFNVVQSCVVIVRGERQHYIHPTAQPIEVDDEQAAELVAEGKLEPYPKPIPGDTGTVLDGILRIFPEAAGAAEEIGPLVVDDEPAADPQPRRSRKPRTED